GMLDDWRKGRAGAPAPSLDNAVIEGAGPGTSSKLSDEIGEVLLERLGTEHALLLLDAFDEVPDSQRQRLLGALGSWVRDNPKAQVWFSSRVVGYQQPWPIPGRSEAEREMELLPFADDQIVAFVRAFFDGDQAGAQELSELLRRAPQVRGIAQIPL